MKFLKNLNNLVTFILLFSIIVVYLYEDKYVLPIIVCITISQLIQTIILNKYDKAFVAYKSLFEDDNKRIIQLNVQLKKINENIKQLDGELNSLQEHSSNLQTTTQKLETYNRENSNELKQIKSNVDYSTKENTKKYANLIEQLKQRNDKR